MFGTDLALKHQVSEARLRDFLREAERERKVASAVSNLPPRRWSGFDSARASMASLLLRAGNRLMPTEALDDCRPLGGARLELRPGQ